MANHIDTQIDIRIKKGDRFTIFHLPGESNCTLIDFSEPIPFSYQPFDNLNEFEGFAVVPFDETTTQGWWFKPVDLWDMPLKTKAKPVKAKPYSSPYISNETDFEVYSSQFQQMMKTLKSGELKKVILSRVIAYQSDAKNYISTLFQQLCAQYPGTFVYLLSTPETGIWMGASPELLLKKQHGTLETMSLAGTRQLDEMDPAQWNAKELEEQNVVSTYIDRLLDQAGVGNYKKNGPAIAKAGLVTHLRTSYQFSEEGIKGKLGEFLKNLHPTPALGGEPKETALEIIKKVETHPRLFYGGFIGPVNSNNINLFVNIRCMQIEDNQVKIYTGGGLTASSDLVQEWNETILKSQTLLSVLNQIEHNEAIRNI